MPGIWTTNDETAFAAGFKRLAVMFGRDLTPDILDLYRCEVDDLDGDQVAAGLAKCVKESRFWPTVAELRDRAGANNVASMHQRISERATRRLAIPGVVAAKIRR